MFDSSLTGPGSSPDWAEIARLWKLRPGTRYMNHGSFGPSAEPVLAERRRWIERLESQPMDFLLREMPVALDEALARLAALVGCSDADLVFTDNATFGMNAVAESIPLSAGDEVLFTDHEYGAVMRIWQRRCQRTGARVVEQPLPDPFRSADEVVDALWQGVTPRTRVLVVSHITSPTAVTLPVEAICRRAQRAGIATAIDGPHAVATLPLALAGMDCDFYTASCHKWLAAPFGSGFLYVHPRWQPRVVSPVLSWGRNPRPEERPGTSWRDEFAWWGTRDPSPFLSVTAAIDLLESVGWGAFRARIHELARMAREQVASWVGLEPLVPDSPEWYGGMISLPLPAGPAEPLQRALWERHGIEIPVMEWKGRRFLRPSCHLYNSEEDIAALMRALADVMPAS